MNSGKNTPPAIWVIGIAVAGITTFGGIYFWQIFKWPLIVLIIMAASGAVGIKHGIKGVFYIAVVSVIIFLVIWFNKSTEYRAGVAAYEKQDYITAIEKLSKDIASNPDHADAYLTRCQAYQKNGQPQLALSDCNTSMQLGNDSKDELYAARARVYMDLALYEKAINNLTVALKYTDTFSVTAKWYLLYERGIAYTKLNKPDLAIRDLTTTLSIKDDWYYAWWPLGDAFYEQKEYTHALKAYEKYISNYDPKKDKLPETIEQRMKQLRQATMQTK